jgi:hypothetical protein
VLRPGGAAAFEGELTIGRVAMSGMLVAALVGRGHAWREHSCVCVWDSLTQQQLRTISLPSRQHAHFHPNVVVQYSVGSFGLHMALDEYRIALSATCKHGDWIEEADNGSPYAATSLLVVQEFGPDWCRSLD